MRLGQLARHLQISQKEITDYLASESIDMSHHFNAKVDAEIEEKIIRHFNPELLEDKEETTSETTITSDPVEESNPTETAEETPKQDAIEAEKGPDVVQPEMGAPENTIEPVEVTGTPKKVRELTVDDLISEPEDLTEKEEASASPEIDESVEEVIRVKKIKLEGIKVVGKIDLPEPKVKEAEENTETEEVEKKEEKPKKNYRKDRKHHHKGRKQRRSGKRETYEERIKREKREAELKLRKLEKQKKLKKKQYYIENVQANVQIKPPKKSKKKLKAESRVQQEIQKPKNPLKRFWGWLNGKYDNY